MPLKNSQAHAAHRRRRRACLILASNRSGQRSAGSVLLTLRSRKNSQRCPISVVASHRQRIYLHSGNARAARRAQCKNKLSHAEHSCGSIAQCACNYFACVCGCNQTRPPSCRRRAHSPRTAQELPLSSSVANDKPPPPRVPPAFSKIKLGGVGPCSGYPVCGGPPLPNCLVSLCVAMIAITLLATQGHGFRCVSSLHQVSLAFGQPRVASPSRAQPPPASACVRSLRAPRLAVWVPAPASLSA